jgi:hypothetical protein
MPINNSDDKSFHLHSSNKNNQDEKSIEKAPPEEALHPAQVMEMAKRLNMPLSVAAELADIPNLTRQLDEASALAEQGNEEARIEAEILMVELRRRAENYHSYLQQSEG